MEKRGGNVTNKTQLEAMREMGITDEQIELFGKLTDLQKRVALKKLEGLNDVQAYIRGGGGARSYKSARSSSYDVLSNPNVQAFVRSVENDAFMKSVMTREEMAASLSDIGSTTIHDIMNLNTETILMINPETDELVEIEGQTSWSLKPIHEMTGAGAAMITELSVGRDGGYKVKTQSTLAAKKQLADLLGYNKPQELKVTVNKTLDDFYNGDA